MREKCAKYVERRTYISPDLLRLKPENYLIYTLFITDLTQLPFWLDKEQSYCKTNHGPVDGEISTDSKW